MIKMVASDLDGTLLVNGSQSIPEEIFPLIKKLKDMGILLWQPAEGSTLICGICLHL